MYFSLGEKFNRISQITKPTPNILSAVKYLGAHEQG